MISVAEADLFHQLCRNCTLSYRRVDHGLFRAFSDRTNRLVRSLDGVDEDDAWGEFVRALRRYRFELSAAPLAFNDPSVAPRMDANALNWFVATATITHPQLAGSARDIVDLLLRLLSSPDSPLLAAIAAILSATRPDRAGVVVAESRLVRPTRSALLSLPNVQGVAVTTADGLRRSGFYDLLIVIGAAGWFPEHVFSAPRASAIELVSYAWLRSRWSPTQTFLAPTVGRSVPPRAAVADNQDGLDDIGLEIDWSRIERRLADENEDGAGGDVQDLIKARLYSLQDGYAVFVEATGRKTTLVIDLDADEDDRVAQVSDEDIEPGMFVVLRNDDSGDYIVPVADKILGQRAASYRADHARWKRALRDRVRRDGLQATSRLLIAGGSAHGDETNLRHWISERNIAPRDQSDFMGIARLVGLADEAERLWRIAYSIRMAHLRAGAAIRRQLVAKVKSADVAELEARGRMDFELPEVEGGRLTAFRVEGRSSSTTFQLSARLERSFKAKD